MAYQIQKIHSRPYDEDPRLRVELFEVVSTDLEPPERPFRVRIVDVKTEEAGPVIWMYESLGAAAMAYEKHAPTW